MMALLVSFAKILMLIGIPAFILYLGYILCTTKGFASKFFGIIIILIGLAVLLLLIGLANLHG